MIEHTPGPWERRRNWIEQCDPGKGICRVEFPINTKQSAADPREEAEAFANANLIAASPDMLAALECVHAMRPYLSSVPVCVAEEKNLLDTIRRYGWKYNMTHGCGAFIEELVDAAIAKAKGVATP